MMIFNPIFSAATGIWNRFTGRTARRVYLAIALLLLIATTAARISTYLLTRKIQAVLSGLEKLRIDQTTEQEVKQTVPYLNKCEQDVQQGASVRRCYSAVFSNEDGWMKLARMFSYREKMWLPNEWILVGADWLGFRYLRFTGGVWLLDGKVSSVSYAVATELVFPRQIGYIVSAESAHGIWVPYRKNLVVSSEEDESPQFRVRGSETHLKVVYTPDAPPEKISHAFKVQLHCFWSTRGCHLARQISPLLSRDRIAIEAATLARLKSNEPCPERILSGRLKYLPDVGVALLKSKGFRHVQVNIEGRLSDETVTDYELAETLPGQPTIALQALKSSRTIPYPGDYTRELPNFGIAWTDPGQEILIFSNPIFDSCRMMLATPSALLDIRSTETAPRRAEDETGFSLQ